MAFDKDYFDAGINRIGTDCEKWDGMIASSDDPEMIPMWVADMDFPSAPAIQEAVMRVANWGTWGYTISGERDAKALCDFWARQHLMKIEPDEVIMSPCVITGMRVALRALTKEGDGVLINPPVYGPFFQSIKVNGRKVVESPLELGEDQRFHMNLGDMEGKLASGEAKAVMMCSPHNPCGRSWEREELEAVVALCVRYGVPLICDEIHADFVFAPKKHTCILDVEGAKEMTVMLCAASKTFNVAGLQQSSIVCKNEKIREAMKQEMEASGVRSGNAFALAATRSAYTDCDAWLDGLKVYLKDNCEFVMQYMAKHMPRIRVTPLDATYLMWLDCSALGLAQEELMKRLNSAHVKVNDGTVFGKQGEGYIRLNIACPKAQLEKALKAMETVLN